MSKISLIILILNILSIINTLNIPVRNSSYPLESDCEGSGRSEIPKEVNDCIDHRINRKFKCCYVEIYNVSTNEFNRYCMRVKKKNSTDLNELRAYVSTKGLYNVVTCNDNFIKYSIFSILLSLLFI